MPNSHQKKNTKSSKAITKFEITVGNKYRLGSLIQSGNGREIFEGENLFSGEKVAIKLQKTDTRTDLLVGDIDNEAKILNQLQGSLGVPLIFWNGEDGDYKVVATELLGKDLEYIKDMYCGGSFSLKTSIMIADQVVSIIEYCFSRGVVHGGIQPSNLCMGLDNNFFHVHLINFENAMEVRNTHDMVPNSQRTTSLGDPMFCPISRHLGSLPSTRDDLESLIYVILFMMTGSLPWGGVLQDPELGQDEVLEGILQLKQGFLNSDYWDSAIIKLTSIEEESLINIPEELRSIYRGLRMLEEGKEPDFMDIKCILKELLATQFLEYDYIYDWVLIPEQSKTMKDYSTIEDIEEGAQEITMEEEQLIQQMILDYEDDPSDIDFRLAIIKSQVQKYEMIKLKNDKGGKKQSKFGLGGSSNVKGGKKDGKKRKERDCTLI